MNVYEYMYLLSLSALYNALRNGSFENEALENEDRSTSFSRFGCFVLRSSFSKQSLRNNPLTSYPWSLYQSEVWCITIQN